MLVLVGSKVAASAVAIVVVLDYWLLTSYTISFACGSLLFPTYVLSAAHMPAHLSHDDILKAAEGVVFVYTPARR